MTRRVILGLLLLWIVGGAVWALFLRSPAEPTTDEFSEILIAEDEDAAEAAPELATRELPAGGEKAGRLKTAVPAWVLKERGLQVSPKRDRLLAWLKGDPRRVLALLHARTHVKGTPPNAFLCRWAFRATRNYFTGVGADFAFLTSVLAAELKKTSRDPLFVSAALGALAALGSEAQTALPDIMQVAHDGRRLGPVRSYALSAAIAVGGITSPVVTTFSTLYLGERPLRGMGRTQVLIDVQQRAEDAAALVPALLELCNQPGGPWGDLSTILIILAAAAPDDPAIIPVMARALGHTSGAVRLLAHRAVLNKGPDWLLVQLRTVGGLARIEGIMLLQEKGVPTRDLVPVLLLELGGMPSSATDRAIKLLTTLGAPPRDVLPTVRELFASDKKGQWLTGVQILGALSRSQTDREPVMRQLFTAVRLPDVRVRKIAVQSLLMFDDQLDAIVPLLADLLDDTESEVRVEAVDGLGELSAHDARAKSHLERALGDSSEEVRALARYWLEEEE